MAVAAAKAYFACNFVNEGHCTGASIRRPQVATAAETGGGAWALCWDGGATCIVVISNTLNSSDPVKFPPSGTLLTTIAAAVGVTNLGSTFSAAKTQAAISVSPTASASMVDQTVGGV